MKTLEEGSKKIQQIIEVLKNDAIEPAKKEAAAIIDEAKAKAQQIIADAQKEAAKINAEAKTTIEQERNVFRSFTEQATKQSMESLRQDIEKKFFREELQQLLEKQASDPKVIARIIEAVIKSIEKEGLSADLSAAVAKSVSPKEVNAFLAENIINKLREHSVTVGSFGGGVQIKLHDKKLTVDITDQALIELLSSYRKGFRELVFQR